MDYKKIRTFTMDKDMASVICQNSKENLSAFLKRMGVEVDDSLIKEALAVTLKDLILDNPEYILYILGKDILEFMISIWENDELEISQAHWGLIGQLKLLGFVDYPQPFFQDGQIDSIYVIREAKEALYFYMKSKTARRLMEKYNNWDVILRGMLTFYGIISFQRLYFYFCKTCHEPVDDEMFHLFLSVRISLLSFGGFAMEKYSKTEYYQNYEVSDPENILDDISNRKDIDYYVPDYDTFYLVGNNNGLGEWEGLSELASTLMDDLSIEYYKAVVLVKSTVLMIQNGESLENTFEQFSQWCPESNQRDLEIKKAIRTLYRSIPLYHLKGWSRRDLNKKNKTAPVLKMIKGGKEKEERR